MNEVEQLKVGIAYLQQQRDRANNELVDMAIALAAERAKVAELTAQLAEKDQSAAVPRTVKGR